jgi:hypothetical protein
MNGGLGNYTDGKANSLVSQRRPHIRDILLHLHIVLA